MKIINNKYWIYLLNQDSKNNDAEIKGKYLFFSDDQELLKTVATKILNKYDLYCAKISREKNKNKGFGYVLCIYDSLNRYCNDLRSIQIKGLNFRYWKSDESTRNGVYSKEYLKS